MRWELRIRRRLKIKIEFVYFIDIVNKMEKWKPILKFEKYLISDFGNVKNSSTGKILKSRTKNGYLTINLINPEDKKCKTFTISRLVAYYFVEGYKEGYKEGVDLKVNHIDGNKLNNHFSNLEWISQKQNIIHANENNLVKYHNQQIDQYDNQGNFIQTFNSMIEASQYAKVSRHAIGNVVRGKSSTSAGYIWKYSNPKIVFNFEMSSFKKIEDFSNYFVNEKGEVYSQFKKNCLKPIKNDNGYYYVTLCDGLDIRKNIYIHQLVARHFIFDRREDQIFVNHKDSDKTNNNVSNLEWTNQSENTIHNYEQRKLKSSLQN